MFAALMRFMKANKILPQISDTERQALEAGSVWIDGGYFSGNPDFSSMLAEAYNTLNAEERAFLDGPTDELCRMIDRYTIARTRRVPEHVIDYMKKQGFFGLLIPKEFGGKGYSVLLRSAVMAKLSPVSTIVGTWVVIPNSLGAAELLIHYGTDAQKQHYLPKLASGEYVPCFGLTEPTAGSDAASIKAEGLVFKDADGKPKIKLNFRKRYITLAPVANLISVACQLQDPDNLLGKGQSPGITVVLVHKGTPGLHIGDHHEPIGDAFPNGPIVGQDVVVATDQIVGGTDYAGQGWRMLMEQLAGGRAISLPAGAVGGAKSILAVTGAYSMVRQQFGIPVGRMEGVEDKVGKIAGLTYALEASRVFACSAIDGGHQPPVISAILKAYTTEIARDLGKEAMDVFAGAGVMQGPNNIVGKGYSGAPVAITVEGANIMTRTLIIFGQGATRCHPYALKVVKAVEQDDAAAFRNNLLAWFGHFFVTIGRTFIRTLTRGWSAGSPVSGPTASYYRRLGWAASRYAMLTNLAMFFIGGKLKARGKLTGRYADALAWQFLGFSALRRYEAEGRRAEDLPMVRYACDHALREIQLAFEGIYANFQAPLVGLWMRTFGSALLRLNPLAGPMADKVSHEAALCIDHFDEQYERLIDGVFHAPETFPGTGRLMRAFRLVTEAHAAAERIILAQRKKVLTRGLLPAEVGDEAVKAGIVTAAEARLLKEALAARLEAIEVDVFTPEQFYAQGATGPVAAVQPRLAVNA
ncbi:MAG TPA: acyl-CoA dehydrogenase [Verrucomicrobiae bacterium]|nr:acyl-CoA dehydrogenase [Verrucomicrobiae bacterium]